MRGIVKGYRVDTFRGCLPVESLLPGDVLTHTSTEGEPLVLRVRTGFVSWYFEIRTQHKTLKMSGDQKIQLADGTELAASELTENHKVRTHWGAQPIMCWKRFVCVPVVEIAVANGLLVVEGFILSVKEEPEHECKVPPKSPHQQ